MTNRVLGARFWVLSAVPGAECWVPQPGVLGARWPRDQVAA